MNQMDILHFTASENVTLQFETGKLVRAARPDLRSGLHRRRKPSLHQIRATPARLGPRLGPDLHSGLGDKSETTLRASNAVNRWPRKRQILSRQRFSRGSIQKLFSSLEALFWGVSFKSKHFFTSSNGLAYFDV